MKYGYAALIAIACTVACAAPTASSESTDDTAQALSTQGVTASININARPIAPSKNFSVIVTVANKSANPMSNWQVAINMNQSRLTAGSVSNAEAATINGQLVFSATANNASLAPGASATFNFAGVTTGTSWTPTVANVDGDANGTTGTTWPSDGIDHIARAAATGAMNVAIAYENNKLANTGDANYAQYDNLLWSAQQYVISGSRIAFDPNMPGYAFIPPEAMNALDAMQDNPEVASYLTAGLQSCFADTKSSYIYAFRAQTLKGYQNNTTTTGTMNGVIPAIGNSPPGYNQNNTVDNFTTVGMQSGGAMVNITETSTTPNPDMWFGLLTFMTLGSFPNTTAVAAKFGAAGQTAACSPFNGPGGSANPYFAISLNGQNVAPRFTGVGAQCQNGCTSKFVGDPTPYATPGPYYNAAGLVGPQANPFAFDPSQSMATPDHVGQWATTTSTTGTTVFGIFNSPISKRGVISGYSWLQCGTPGAGC